MTLSSDSELSHKDQSPSEEYLPEPNKVQSKFSLSSEEGEDKSNAAHRYEEQSSIKDNSKLPLKIESSESRMYTKRKNPNERGKGTNIVTASFMSVT